MNRQVNKKKSQRAHRKTVRTRRYNEWTLSFVAIAVLLSVIVIAITLFRIQVLEHENYRELAAAQHYSRQTIYPMRGGIFDANGTRIAGTHTVFRVGMTPSDARSYLNLVSLDEIADQVATALSLDRDEFRAQMDEHEETYLLLAKEVSEETTSELRAWLNANGVGGFRFDAEPRRVYSNNDLAGQIIGYTRFDEQQLSGALGIELQFDALLTGKAGYSYARRDNYASRGVVPYTSTTDLAVENGADLYLTIDLNIQRVLQETLIEAAASVGLSTKVTGMVMDPWTGAILAMGQLPLMRSDDPYGAPATIDETAWEQMGAAQVDYLMANVWRNQNVSDLYEPGSTMKSITAAIAFEMSITNESVLYSDDPITIRGHEISCHEKDGHGVETLEAGFVNSCNPVFVQVGYEIGIENYYEYFRQLGFYERTGVDLPGEATALIHTYPTDLDFANLTFGESTAVTPLQMLTAYAAIANGGKQVVPHVVDYALSDGLEVYRGSESTGVPLMSQQTALRVRNLMSKVVTDGIGSTHGIEGYRIGGKTSTSTDEDTNENTYSYIAIAPIDAPRIVAMIILERPQVNVPSSIVAVRPTNRLVSRVLDILGEPRNLAADDYASLNKTVVMPDLTGQSLKDASFRLSQMDVWAYPGDLSMLPDDPVMQQMPVAGSVISPGARVYLYPAPLDQVEWVTVPDFSGKSFFEAQALACDAGVVLKAIGVTSAGITRQTPAPTHALATVPSVDQSGAPLSAERGDMVPRGSVITVYFDNAGSTNDVLPDEAGD